VCVAMAVLRAPVGVYGSVLTFMASPEVVT